MSTKNLSPVLKTSFVLLAILVLLGIVMPDGYQVWSEQLREVISDKLGWFYLLLVTSIVLLCGFFLVIVIISRVPLFQIVDDIVDCLF